MAHSIFAIRKVQLTSIWRLNSDRSMTMMHNFREVPSLGSKGIHANRHQHCARCRFHRGGTPADHLKFTSRREVLSREVALCRVVHRLLRALGRQRSIRFSRPRRSVLGCPSCAGNRTLARCSGEETPPQLGTRRLLPLANRFE